MKTPLLITVFTILFQLQSSAKTIQNILPFGSKEKIIKIRELPDTSEFQLKDGTYYDIGSLYSKKQFLWLGYSYGTPEYVGYMGSQEKYVPLTESDLNKVAGIAKIQLPLNPEITFFDTYISRPLLLIIVLLMSYYGYQFYIKRKHIIELRAQEEIPSWPPSIQDVTE